jgi:hypothetical protein
MYNVIEARKSKNRITHVVAKQDGGTESLIYSAVRGGLSWPAGTMPGYHCILGEEYIYINKDEAESQRGKLHLLSEHEYPGMSIDMMLARLTDDVTQLHCGEVYADTKEEYQDYLESYQDFCYKKKVSLGRIEQAPFADNFQLGISLINDWLRTGRLVLPEQSIVREQLKRISKQELDDKPENKFYAINGLRSAVAAFHKFRPVRHSGAWKNRRRSAMAI